MQLLTRKQFRELWSSYQTGLGNQNSPVWVPEGSTGAKPSRYFLMIKPILDVQYYEFQLWCEQHCRGQVLCYSISYEKQEAWYGFTHRADIYWFALRWA